MLTDWGWSHLLSLMGWYYAEWRMSVHKRCPWISQEHVKLTFAGVFIEIYLPGLQILQDLLLLDAVFVEDLHHIRWHLVCVIDFGLEFEIRFVFEWRTDFQIIVAIRSALDWVDELASYWLKYEIFWASVNCYFLSLLLSLFIVFIYNTYFVFS